MEEVKRGIESLSEADLSEVAVFLSELRCEAVGRLTPKEFGGLASRLAGNKNRAESDRLSTQIIDGFYAGS